MKSTMLKSRTECAANDYFDIGNYARRSLMVILDEFGLRVPV